jgi:hypothetical protein
VRGTTRADLERDLRDEQLAGQPWLWIDRMRDRTSPPLDIETLRSAPDFLGDLVRQSDELAADPAALEAAVADLLAPVESSLGVVDLELTPAQLLERARDACLDRLGGEA